MPTISYFQIVGVRPQQEDRYTTLHTPNYEILAVADGFSKDDRRGGDVADRVLAILQEAFLSANDFPGMLDADARSAFTEIFGIINEHTEGELSGSTLSVVVITVQHVHVAVLGDSPVAVAMKDEVRVFPEERLGQGGAKLWGCFGDCENKDYHLQQPEIETIPLEDVSHIIVATDGLYTSDDEVAIREDARQYCHAVALGANSENLTDIALLHGSRDNITVIIWTK